MYGAHGNNDVNSNEIKEDHVHEGPMHSDEEMENFQGGMGMNLRNNGKNLYAKGNDLCHDCLKALLLAVIFYLLSQKEVHNMMKKCCKKMTTECIALLFFLIVWLLFNLKWI